MLNTRFSLSRIRIFFLLLISFVWVFSPVSKVAQAHAYSASFTTLDLTKEQTKLSFLLDEISVIELTSGDVNHNGMLEPEEFNAIKSKMEKILQEHLILKINDKEQNWSKIEEMSLNRKGENTQLHFVATYPALLPSQSISLTDNLYQNDTKNYVDLVKINYGNQNSTSALSGTNRTWSMILSDNDYAGFHSNSTNSNTVQPTHINTKTDQPISNDWFSFLKLGMNHILSGYDHLLFLLSLIIARQSFKQFATVITAFTLAHSLTLTLTVLGIIHVPPSIVEPAIALSICYVAIDNIIRKEVSHRWVLTFFFGLIHGMGFADILVGMHIPKSELAIDLASFNIGIEIIQLSIIALLLPLLALLHRSKYSRYTITSISTIAFLLGGIWLFQRILS
ncbi:HupE/UreJ family protein [Bacillus sp. RG28]|uniref:HupE/UreJ family protein n=1 Tax=Gottfriedia endophytica TaxID=2820819 RepID=A0A940NRQ3_9BACI|nr:HupE/UreJ family protein [Gottfriedia endophytica]MBP0723673.1 HupE/UreJ family protein [Gottfriedia endophytica]